jgi:PAS domain S-box-containing protein
MLVDASGQVKLANRRTEDLFRFQAGQLVGRDIEVLISERPRTAHVDQQAYPAVDGHTRETVSGREWCGKREDGSEFPVEISFSLRSSQRESRRS